MSATVDQVRDFILHGATVRMGFARGARVWWIERPHVDVDDETMAVAALGSNGQPLLEEAGDSLFGWRGNSQTWRSAYGCDQ